MNRSSCAERGDRPARLAIMHADQPPLFPP